MRIILLRCLTRSFLTWVDQEKRKSFNRPLTKREELYTIYHNQTEYKGLGKKELV